MNFLTLAAVMMTAVAPAAAPPPAPPAARAAAEFHWSTTTVKSLAPGVTLTQDSEANPALLVDFVTVDSGLVGTSIAPAIADNSLTGGTGDIRNGRESVPALVARERLIAAVNGDYFPFTGDPLGLGIVDGEVYSEPFSSASVAGRAAIGWTADGRAMVGIPKLDASLRASDGSEFPITGIDRLTSAADPNDLVLSTARYGPTSASRGGGADVVLRDAGPLPVQPGRPVWATVMAVVTGDPLPVTIPESGLVVSAPAGGALAARLANHFHVGDRVRIVIDLSDITPPAIGAAAGSWDNVREAIGGGPILLKSGQVVVDGAAEGFPAAFTDTLHARTAVGVRSDGSVLIVTVDGDSAISAGITLPDLANLLKSLGAVDAINLDGGGSTTLSVFGLTVGFPLGSDYERRVADMLTVRSAPAQAQAKKPAAAAAQIVLPAGPIAAGGAYPLALSEAGQSIPGSAAGVVWAGPVGVCGFVTQDGIFHALKPGAGTIAAIAGGSEVSAAVTVIASTPASAAPPGQATAPTATVVPPAPPQSAPVGPTNLK